MPNNQLPISSRPDSVMFPKPGEAWTHEQRNSIWGGNVAGMLRDLASDYRASPTRTSEWGGDDPLSGLTTPTTALVEEELQHVDRQYHNSTALSSSVRKGVENAS